MLFERCWWCKHHCATLWLTQNLFFIIIVEMTIIILVQFPSQSNFRRCRRDDDHHDEGGIARGHAHNKARRKRYKKKKEWINCAKKKKNCFLWRSRGGNKGDFRTEGNTFSSLFYIILDFSWKDDELSFLYSSLYILYYCLANERLSFLWKKEAFFGEWEGLCMRIISLKLKNYFKSFWVWFGLK